MRLSALVMIVALTVATLSVGCAHEDDTVPDYALFRNERGVREVGEGEFHHRDGRQSDFYFFAAGDAVRDALSSVQASLDNHGWMTATSTDGLTPLLKATSPDGTVCVRYVDISGDYGPSVANDATLSQLSGIEREVRFGAELAVVVDFDCARAAVDAAIDH